MTVTARPSVSMLLVHRLEDQAKQRHCTRWSPGRHTAQQPEETMSKGDAPTTPRNVLALTTTMETHCSLTTSSANCSRRDSLRDIFSGIRLELTGFKACLRTAAARN